MMSLFAYFAIIGTFICFSLAIIVYFFNRKSRLNQTFIVAILLGGYTAFTAFMVLSAANDEAAHFWSKAGFLWPFFTAFLFQFTLVFTETRFATNKFRLFFLYLPALAFSILNLTTDQLAGFPVNGTWGYSIPNTRTLANIISSTWMFSLSFASLLVCASYCFKVKDEDKKLQARLITVGLVFPLLMNALSVGAYFVFGWVIPYNGSGSNAVLCVFVAIAIWRHGLFNLDPAVAAEKIISTMPDSFILTDVQGLVLRVNPALTNLLGYHEKELAGKPVSQVLVDEETKPILENIAKTKEIKNHETRLKIKDNGQKPVALSASVIENKRGKQIGVTLIIHDLTRRKQNEEKLLKAERFAAIGELAGMIGHDLRNPLTSIQGAAYYLKIKYAKEMNAPAKEMLETIERSIQYSNKIINDLLDYSREIKLEPEETTPKALVANALSLVSNPSDVRLINLTMDSPSFSVDTGKMSRVFVNIIKNACDAMPNGGTLTVASAEAERSLEILFQDTGIGIPLEYIDKLWTPLFTTKAKGMGFGLPICKRIVEAHGGKIQVQSVPEKGTTFTIVLPLDNKTKVGNG
jgi:PAS domain S-box-containing protein